MLWTTSDEVNFIRNYIGRRQTASGMSRLERLIQYKKGLFERSDWRENKMNFNEIMGAIDEEIAFERSREKPKGQSREGSPDEIIQHGAVNPVVHEVQGVK